MKIIDEQLMNDLAEEAKKSPRLRKNYNFHQSLQDKCHRFLNALEPGTLIPVHHHPDKDETFVILKGKVRVSTYNDEGEIVESCVISHESGRYGVDIPKNVWHGLECLEPSVLLECKAGPFVEHEVDGILETKPTKDIYLAGGCFWGTEHYFKQIEGVAVTEVGFANGHTENPTYKEVYTDQTGFAETVFVRFYPDVVSLEFLLQMFFKAIDPTSLNKQGHDEGTRYRTGVYYTDPADLPIIEKVFAEEQKNYPQPLVVEKLPLQNFYTAEEYHQDYLDKNPDGYCHLPLSLFAFARQAKQRVQLERIKRMEQCFDKALAAMKDGSADSLKAIEEDVAELSKYYGSELWKQDFAADEAGQLPPDLKRGVLSEYGIWNLLTEYGEIQKTKKIKNCTKENK